MTAKLSTFSIIEILDARLRDDSYRKGEKARFALMKAAAELLGDQPVSEIRNIDICKKANVATGLLNTYFADKHDLMAQLLALFVERLDKEYEPHRVDLQNETDDLRKLKVLPLQLVLLCNLYYLLPAKNCNLCKKYRKPHPMK